MITLAALESLVAQGESDTFEFKRSTNTLTRYGETLCAFLNGNGGAVVIGVADNGGIVRQEVSDKTQREIAAMLHRFDPPAPVDVRFVDPDGGNRKLIVLEAKAQSDVRPYTFEGRPYQRVQTTTSVMPKDGTRH